MKKCFLILLLSLWNSLVFAEIKPESYTIYSYHPDAPFYLPRQPLDLTRAWVDLFNAEHPETQLELMQVSRPVLNEIVASGQPYLILWANALWFKSRDPNVSATNNIFWDADILISLSNKPINYSEPEDLIGLTIGGRTGYFYKGINNFVKQKKITRIDRLTDQDNFYQLTSHKIDAFIMSRSSFLYWQYTDPSKKNLFSAISPHDAYTRSILVSKRNQPLIPKLNAFIDSLKNNKTWQSYLTTWGVNELINPFELELDELPQY
ncbi:transporter substrate-binding domain-containing protein [Litoribacillus peritrichatus]|uniref:ABC transporter substrate-binding protein n=1 Tax=Litoribacillus peritrichatus TaxID=718191 RepID=A0ABP7MU25_9GAMM